MFVGVFRHCQYHHHSHYYHQYYHNHTQQQHQQHQQHYSNSSILHSTKILTALIFSVILQTLLTLLRSTQKVSSFLLGFWIILSISASSTLIPITSATTAFVVSTSTTTSTSTSTSTTAPVGGVGGGGRVLAASTTTASYSTTSTIFPFRAGKRILSAVDSNSHNNNSVDYYSIINRHGFPHKQQQQQQPPPPRQSPLPFQKITTATKQVPTLKETEENLSISTCSSSSDTTKKTLTKAKTKTKSNVDRSKNIQDNNTDIDTNNVSDNPERKDTVETETNTTSNQSSSTIDSGVKKEEEEEVVDKEEETMENSSQPSPSPPPEPDDQKFRQRILSSLQTVQNWETVQWIQDCRKVIPWDDLRNDTGPYSRPDEDRFIADHTHNALFLQRLCRWFPSQYMNWVNTPPCEKCGNNHCEMKTVRKPETDEERDGGAKRVEVYYCPECDANTTTFPRYNKARKLLDTKRGRCGEYSNLFGLFCRSVGFETRLVLDFSDHLWTEIKLGDDWIMADSCEGIIDKPSMYEDGWGKDGLCFMIAIASDYVVDVTPRYTRKFLSDDFQNRRRTHTTSENATVQILQSINEEIQYNLTKTMKSHSHPTDEVRRARQVEMAELHLCKQSTSWTSQEKYGRGRISGSLAWKQSRSENGSNNNNNNNKHSNSSNNSNGEAEGQDSKEEARFPVESFTPPLTPELSLEVYPSPSGRHDAIVVGGAKCAVGESSNSLSIVVVDQECLGTILMSRSFSDWKDLRDFVQRLPSGRIVIMNGKCEQDKEVDADADAKVTVEGHTTKSTIPNSDFARLGGLSKIADEIVKSGVVFIGQVDLEPDWTYSATLEDCPTKGYRIILNREASNDGPGMDHQMSSLKLRSEFSTRPTKVIARLPESAMPIKTQTSATEEQKRLAFLSFMKSSKHSYSGYTTKSGSPVYLLNAASYPFAKVDSTVIDTSGINHVWNTYHYLPEQLVSQDDVGFVSDKNSSGTPLFDVPIETSFFNTSLGSHLLVNSTTKSLTSQALHNARLVGLYFSAHWCGPCRSFTPMLAEMYAHMKEYQPTHGLEIVFVSGDRDSRSFSNYFGTMPWQAIPFEYIPQVKATLNQTYGVRGIPSFVVLDAVTGAVVVSSKDSRREVMDACRGGEQEIESLLDSWIERTPNETKELLSMLEMSCEEENIKQSSQEDDIENVYLLSESKVFQPPDTAARIKHYFQKLITEGNDPTSAAAKAVGLVAKEQEENPQLHPGPLNGRAIKGTSTSSDDKIGKALSKAQQHGSHSEISSALNTAIKYTENASKFPWITKYRSFKLSNKVADQITRRDGCLDILESLGFEVSGTNEDFKVILPVAMNLDEVKGDLAKTILRLN